MIILQLINKEEDIWVNVHIAKIPSQKLKSQILPQGHQISPLSEHHDKEY